MTAVLASVAFFTSCGGDDESIEGSWKMTSNSEELIINGKTVASESSSILEDEWLIFKGGTATTVYQNTDDEGLTYVYSHSGTYTVKGNKIVMTDEGEQWTYTYKISGSKLTVSMEEDLSGESDAEEREYFSDKYGIGDIKTIKHVMKLVLNKVKDSEVPSATDTPIYSIIK